MKFAPSLRRLLLLSLLLGSCACARAQRADRPQQTPTTRVAIRAARMLDVARGQLIADAVVVVEGERVVAAGSRLNVPAGAQVIDLGDVTLLPGLIDAHTHVTYHFDETGRFGISGDPTTAVTLRYAAENARRTLEAGFTTARNLGAGARVDIQLRDAIRRGELPGPRLLVSGLPLTADAVSDVTNASARAARVREFVRARAAEGADVIKIFEGVGRDGRPVFSREEIAAAVEEAARAKLKVAVHAHEAAAVKAAVEGGCASVEHGTYLDDEAVRLLVRHRTALVPTLYLPTHYLSHRERFAFGDATWEFFERLKAHNFENLRRARRGGVWVVAGSDAVAGLHGENAREVVWLAKAGMTPAEALRAATIDAARLLGLEGQAGELRAGTLADVIAVAGDPLSDVGALERVVFVMKSGAVFKNTLAKTGER